MLVKWKGKDLGEWRGMPTLKEARFIKHELHMLPEEFADAMGSMDPEAMLALVSIMLHRNGDHTKFDDLDGEFDDLDIELSEEEKKQGIEANADELDSTIIGILEELGVFAEHEHIHEVVVRHLTKASEAKKED